jgi:hypothetical protein
MSTIFDDDIDKASKAVTKILRQTLSKELVWAADLRKTPLGAEEYIIGKTYMTQVLDKIVRIFKYKYKYFTDEDEFTWVEGHKLQFTDYKGNPEWEFPYSNAVHDLYEAVSFQTTEVKEFLDKWLNA